MDVLHKTAMGQVIVLDPLRRRRLGHRVFQFSPVCQPSTIRGEVVETRVLRRLRAAHGEFLEDVVADVELGDGHADWVLVLRPGTRLEPCHGILANVGEDGAGG